VPALRNREMFFRARLEPLRERQCDGVALRPVLGHEFVIVAERDEEHLLREHATDFRPTAATQLRLLAGEPLLRSPVAGNNHHAKVGFFAHALADAPFQV